MIVHRMLRHRVVAVLCIASEGLVLGGFFWAFFILRNSPTLLILHYHDIISQYGTVWDLARIAALGVVALGINFFLALELDERDWFLGKLMASVSLFVGILLFIGFAAIISVN